MNRDMFYAEITDLMTIVYRVNRSLSQNAGSELCPIPPTQLQTLMVLLKLRSINMTELAEQMLMTRPQMTKVIDALVERNLVVRKADPANRRHVIIEPTDSSESFIKEMLLTPPSFLARLLDSMDEEDAKKFYDAIAAIKEVLAKIN